MYISCVRRIVHIAWIVVLIGSFTSAQSQESENKRARFFKLIEDCDAFLYDDPTLSKELAEEAHQIAIDFKDDSLIAVALNRIGGANWSIGNLEVSLSYFQQSLEKCEENNFRKLLAQNHGNVGNLYSSAGLLFDAISAYKKEQKFQNELTDNDFRKFVICNNLGRAYQQVSIFDSSMLYFERAKQYVDSSFVNLFSVFYFNIAEAHFNNGNIAEADSILVAALENAELYESKRGLIRIHQLLGEIELKNGNNYEALDHARLAVELAEESKKKELLSITHKTLSRCFAALGDWENAYKHETVHEEHLNSIQSSQAINELELLAYHERDFQVKILDERNKLNTTLADQRQKAIQFLIGGLLIAIVLITVIHERNKKIKTQSDKLAELNEFKNRLFAIVSHDIKSPINSVTMIIDLLESKAVSEEELDFLLPEIRKKSDRLNDLLDSLLKWAEGNLSKKSFNKTALKVKSVFNELEEELTERLNRKNIRIQNEIPDDFMMLSDVGTIRIVFRNLIINAIKFSPRDSEVIVRGLNTASDTIVEVKDQGVGMSEETLKGLFSMEIGSLDGTDGEKGNGLGLVLCNDFIEGQGGKIEVESELGKGSTFKVILPNEDA